MTLKELLSNNKVKQLKPSAFMAYCLLITKAGDGKLITKFSIRGLAKEWEEDKNLGIVKNKETVKIVLTELENAKLIKVDLEKKELRII